MLMISFKLETDPAILLSKVEMSAERYQSDFVIGNLLSNYNTQVTVFKKENTGDDSFKLASKDVMITQERLDQGY